MAVHAELARLLADWKQSGFERILGRPPTAGDLIVPSREERNRNVNHALKRFHEDLDRLELRKRRQHDARRTFISLALAGGARADVLHWVTHGPNTSIIDVYSTLPWSTLCEAVSCLKMSCYSAVTALAPKTKNPEDSSPSGSFRGGVDGT